MNISELHQTAGFGWFYSKVRCTGILFTSSNQCISLRANEAICFQGMNPVGEGFRVTGDEIVAMGDAAKWRMETTDFTDWSDY